MSGADAAVLYARGLAQQRAGQHQAAIQMFRQVLNERGPSAEVLCRIGMSYEALRDLQHADDAYVEAIACEPEASEAYLRAADLARRASTLAQRVGQHDAAREFRRAAFQYLYSLGARSAGRGAFAQAEAAFRRALAVEPGNWSAHVDLGQCLYRMRQLRAAEALIREGVRLAPNEAKAHYHLGAVLLGSGRAEEAEAALRRAVALDPANAEAQAALGDALRALGRTGLAEAQYQQASATDPAAVRGYYLMGPIYDGAGVDQILTRHRAWGDQTMAAAKPTPAERAPFANSRAPDRRLRVGYVSPDLKSHSVAYFFEPLLARHNPNAVETFCYAEVAHPDETTARLKSLSAHWRSTIGMNDEVLRRQVRDDAIDILIDLAGHTDGNRLAAFAIKPAPVTASWLGYPTTTGLATVDWRLTDTIADPPGAEAHHVERLMRLDRGFLCFRPPAEAPAVAPLPAAAASGRVTFGSFNNLLKLTPAVAAAWADILKAVPESRLLLKALLLRDAAAQQRIKALFAACGIAPERVETRGGTNDRESHLAAYGEVDIALDPFPYNGTATTCEALWMGVPVVALSGDRHCGRVGQSVLHHAGLPELVQRDRDDYVRCVVALASDIPALGARRAGLRSRVAASALCDEPGFVRSFEAALRRMWVEWCNAAACP